jgi:Raf kinase inhibitor-like YbhB/YbcL family protein
MTLTLISPAFGHNEEIPSTYTCDGKNISPPLAWSGVPAEAKSLALVVDDPDAPGRTWVHWVLYNLPPDGRGLPEAVKPQQLPAGTREGLSDFRSTGYGGPCPPSGRHRYFHKLYALDTVFPDLGAPAKAKLEKAMRGHILAEAGLVGTYARSP